MSQREARVLLFASRESALRACGGKAGKSVRQENRMRQLKSRKGVEYSPCVGDPAEGKVEDQGKGRMGLRRYEYAEQTPTFLQMQVRAEMEVMGGGGGAKRAGAGEKVG